MRNGVICMKERAVFVAILFIVLAMVPAASGARVEKVAPGPNDTGASGGADATVAGLTATGALGLAEGGASGLSATGSSDHAEAGASGPEETGPSGRADQNSVEWVNPAPTVSSLSGLAWKSGNPYGLIAGHAGTLMRFDPSGNQKFTLLQTGVPDNLNAVAYRPGSATALAVGDSGLVLNYDGNTFIPPRLRDFPEFARRHLEARRDRRAAHRRRGHGARL